MKVSTLVQRLVNQEVSAYRIQQKLKSEGVRVWCFGSYYTIKEDKRYFCFFETDNGARCNWVDSVRSAQTAN